MSCDISLIIDLNGETCKAVCMDQDRKLHQVKTLSGSLEIPTAISFEKRKCLVGEKAIKNAEKNLSNTIFSLEQYLNSNKDLDLKFPRFTDAVQYTLINSKINFSIARNTKKMSVYLEEVFSYLIAHLIDLAKTATGAKTISKVVILTQFHIDKKIRWHDIETYWHAQEILRTIGLGTKLKVLTIEKSFLYEREYIRSIAKKSSCVVFNFEHEAFSVNDAFKSMSGHKKYRERFRSKIGARDCESQLVQYFLDSFTDYWGSSENMKKNHLAMYQIREACRKAIVKLSSQEETMISVSIKNKEFYALPIAKKKFEELCHPIFKKIIDFLEEIYPINNNQIYKSEVLVLIGNMAAFPLLEKMIVNFFRGRSKDIQVHKSKSSEIFDLAYRYKENWEMTKLFNRTHVKMYDLSIGHGSCWGFTNLYFDTPFFTIPAQFSKTLLRKAVSCNKVHTIHIYEGNSALQEFNKHLINLTLPYVSLNSDKKSCAILTVRLTEYGQIVLTNAEANNPYNRISVFMESQNKRYTPSEIRTFIWNAEDRETEERELKASMNTLIGNWGKFDTMRKRLRQLYPLLSEKHDIFESSTVEFKKQLEKEIEDAESAFTSSARDVATEYFVQAQFRIEKRFEELETRYLNNIQKTAER